jgi:hypothetical protein
VLVCNPLYSDQQGAEFALKAAACICLANLGPAQSITCFDVSRDGTSSLRMKAGEVSASVDDGSCKGGRHVSAERLAHERSAAASRSSCMICLRTTSNLSSTISLKSGSF